MMHYVKFGSNISPGYVMPADTHRHVIHKKKNIRIYVANMGFGTVMSEGIYIYALEVCYL